MDLPLLTRLFDLTDRTVAITGAGGVLCSEMALALVDCGARVAVLDRDLEAASRVQNRLASERRERALPIQCDVLSADSLTSAAAFIVDRFGGVDALINGAGGNRPDATTSEDRPFFDLPADALRGVLDLNLVGTILPSQIFGRVMAKKGDGVILNISSMNALRPLTRIPAYSAAKAGVSNFTQWLAVHMAQEYSPRIRVNAIAPGFFLTRQNEFLLIDTPGGGLTPRGQTIIAHTPMARFGTPADLFGAVLWLLSPAASFVTGTVVPIDGGFSAFSGV